jgi:hypothetical protein
LKKILTVAVLIVSLLTLAACGSTGALVVTGVAAGANIVQGLSGSDADRSALCTYYTEHRTEVEAVRTYAKANWQRVPEQYKPSLLAINDQLNACDAPEASVGSGTKTTTQALFDALQRAVKFYRELHAAGIV